MFYKGVQDYLCFCLDQLNRVKPAAFQFDLQERRKVAVDQVMRVGWVGETLMLFLVKKCSWWSRNVRRSLHSSWCNSQLFSRRCSGTASAHIFKQSPQNVRVEVGINCLASCGKFFVLNPHDVEANDASPVSPFLVFMRSEFSIGRIVALSQGRKTSSHRLRQTRTRK